MQIQNGKRVEKHLPRSVFYASFLVSFWFPGGGSHGSYWLGHGLSDKVMKEGDSTNFFTVSVKKFMIL